MKSGHEWLRALLVAVSILVVAGMPVVASGTTAVLTAEVTVKQMLLLDLDPETLVFTFDDIITAPLDQEAGKYVVVREATNADYILRTWSFGNVDHQITVRGLPYVHADETTSFGLVSPERNVLPWEQLEWRFSPYFHPEKADDQWFSLAEDESVLYPGGAYEENHVFLDFRLTVYISDPIGVYEGLVEFTLSALE